SALTVNTSGGGTTTFGGAVGATHPLTTLTTNADGMTALNGGSVHTSGAQTYNDSVTLGADTTLSTNNPTGADVTLAAVNGGNHSRTVTAGTVGHVTFGGALSAMNNATASGASVSLGGKLSAAGMVQFTASDGVANNSNNNNITINAAIDPPTTVLMTSDDDIIINAAITATNLIELLAGQDGSGSVLTNAGGTLTTTNAGSDIVAHAGAMTGSITLGDSVRAVDEVDLVSQQGLGQAGGAVTGTNLFLQGAGTFSLTQANNVATLAASNTGGSVEYRDSDGFTVGSVTDVAG